MDVKNHNTNRKKRVARKRWNTAIFIALFVGILLTVFRYFEFVSKTVYEESVSHLTEIFHQSDNASRRSVKRGRATTAAAAVTRAVTERRLQW